MVCGNCRQAIDVMKRWNYEGSRVTCSFRQQFVLVKGGVREIEIALGLGQMPQLPSAILTKTLIAKAKAHEELCRSHIVILDRFPASQLRQQRQCRTPAH